MVSGTVAGLRAKLARGGPVRKEKRPDGVKPLGRMKLHYLHCTDILYLYSRTVPEGELRFF